jgi:hypothetical protein
VSFGSPQCDTDDVMAGGRVRIGWISLMVVDGAIATPKF